MSAAGIITRARRQAAVTTALHRATTALRGIATGLTPADQVRATAIHYCRLAGIPRAAIDKAALAFIKSDGASVMLIEDLDEWLIEHARDASASAAAATAIAQARRA